MTVLMAEADAQLAAELWLSFRSVLRSYAAASSLHNEEITRIEWSESDIILASAAARLELRFDLATGRGSWHLHGNDTETAHGHFNLLPQGALERDGKVLDLDHAAIDFVDLVLKGNLLNRPESASVLKGHDFSRAEKSANNEERASAPEGRAETDTVLKGHDFSRAEEGQKREGALAPEGTSSKAGSAER
jgi:hypothetical protein